MNKTKNNKQEYWYVYGDKKVADIIEKVTGERYMIFDNHKDNIKVYSFKKTYEVLIAYNSIKEYKKYNI